MELAVELQRIYDSEINAEIRWFWDGGFTVRLGDKMNGFLAEEDVNSVADILPWLQAAIARFYPDSDYAQSLEPAVKARAARGRRIVSFDLREPVNRCVAPTAGWRTLIRDYLMSCWPSSATTVVVLWKSKHRR
jgi:hypothetical protein